MTDKNCITRKHPLNYKELEKQLIQRRALEFQLMHPQKRRNVGRKLDRILFEKGQSSEWPEQV
jgi:hypothetical protein